MEKKPEIVVVPDLPALVEEAARRIADAISRSNSRAAICLSGGSTPKPVYERLTQEPYRSEIDWSRTHWFWGDERFVPLDDERSNARMAYAAILDRVPVPRENIHVMPVHAANPNEAASAYEKELKSFYGRGHLDPAQPLFDVVLMGLGSDGHTASLFPGNAEVGEQEHWVAGVDRPGLAPFVPRITLTFPALASTGEMIFLVSGHDKRDMVRRVLAGDDLPAARAHADGKLVWLLDRAAAPDIR